jgi:hypothetical protein
MRHRHKKISEKAKAFNPLIYFLQADRNLRELAPDTLLDEDEDTFIGAHLRNNIGKVSPTLVEVKKLTHGRKSILHNHQRIYRILWNNLQVEDSWELLQALIRDTKALGLDLWFEEGFEKLAESITTATGLNFTQNYFEMLFSTLCMFYEICFDELSDRVQDFFMVFSRTLMRHQNKHIRKFSLQSFSYVLSNISEEQYTDFMRFLIGLQSEGFFDDKLSLAALLVQRLKVVKGCLTTASLTFALSQLTDLV